MLIIGECINSTTPEVLTAIEIRNVKYIQDLSEAQALAGADFIDVNAGARIKTEQEDIAWLIKTVTEVVTVPISIDSANTDTIKHGLEIYSDIKRVSDSSKFPIIINSINGERTHCEKVLPLVKEYNCDVIGLLMDENGIPNTPEGRVKIGHKIIEMLNEFEISIDHLYLDMVIQPISTDTSNGLTILETLRLSKRELPDVKTVLGLSNISFGLPEKELINRTKELINRTFLAMLMVYGLDAAILNPMDNKLLGTLQASEMLLDQDEYCMNFITAYRDGRLNFK
jgi:5-methyltetrahydrofolate--homocysteine methyltransferase